MPRLVRPPLRVIVWAAATVVLLLVAALLWRGSDAAATESTTAAPAAVPAGTPAGAVSETWSTAAILPSGTVVEGGRVLVGSRHGVRALDPVTGREVWHYTRSNARMCGLTAVDGVAVAAFATRDRCDEAVALHADTGVRAWTRSVSFRGDATLVSTDRIVMATSPSGIVTIDPTGDNIRWRYAAPPGCRLQSAVGSAGVAVLQTCDRAPMAQLRLFDGFSGAPHWTRDVPVASKPRLLGAGAPTTLLADGQVQALAPADGAVLSTRPIPAGDDVQVGVAGALTLVRIGGELAALDATSGTAMWTVPATGLPATPAVATSVGGAQPLVVPDGLRFVSLDPVTGTEVARSATSVPVLVGTATAVGPVVLFRLPDRVIAFR